MDQNLVEKNKKLIDFDVECLEENINSLKKDLSTFIESRTISFNGEKVLLKPAKVYYGPNTKSGWCTVGLKNKSGNNEDFFSEYFGRFISDNTYEKPFGENRDFAESEYDNLCDYARNDEGIKPLDSFDKVLVGEDALLDRNDYKIQEFFQSKFKFYSMERRLVGKFLKDKLPIVEDFFDIEGGKSLVVARGDNIIGEYNCYLLSRDDKERVLKGFKYLDEYLDRDDIFYPSSYFSSDGKFLKKKLEKDLQTNLTDPSSISNVLSEVEEKIKEGEQKIKSLYQSIEYYNEDKVMYNLPPEYQLENLLPENIKKDLDYFRSMIIEPETEGPGY